MPNIQLTTKKKVQPYSTKIVDNLAEITSHLDRSILEKSLLKTINELFVKADLRLYRVRAENAKYEQDLALLAYCVNEVVVSSEKERQLQPDKSEISEAISEAVHTGQVSSVEKESGGWHFVYPAFDGTGEIFAVLLMSLNEVLHPNDQRLIFSILKVYSNYLSLIEKTQRDKLTGLYNRETLNSEITKLLVGRASQLPNTEYNGEDLRKSSDAARSWLGVIDIDHFKNINDTYGHLYGDEVIILVARMMTSGCIREEDLVYRYGGEEFVVILKAGSEEDADRAFERLRNAIAEHSFPQVENVTISIGFVEIAEQQSPADVIGEADQALYYAKQNGRNQVHSYHNLLAQGKIQSVKTITESDIELF